MIFCECNNSIIKWTYPGNDIVDRYVVNISSHTDYRTLKVNGSSTYQATLELEGLSLELDYNIIVRAYQDILGPPSEPLPYYLEGNCVHNCVVNIIVFSCTFVTDIGLIAKIIGIVNVMTTL